MSPTSQFNEDVLNNNKNETSEKKVPFPYKITKVDDGTNKELLTYFTGEKTGFVQVGPKKWFFPSGYEYEAENYYNFEVRPDDIFIVTFPRSGTTWMQEMVWLLANDLNYQKAAEIPLVDRFPFLEFSSFVHKDTKAEFLRENAYDAENYEHVQNIDVPAWRVLAETTGQRFIKTHLPFSLLPPNLLDVGAKVIYVARNPKDVAVSFYHLNRLMRTQGYIGDFPKYWDYFERNLRGSYKWGTGNSEDFVVETFYIFDETFISLAKDSSEPWTPYWEHIKEGWSRRNEQNLLFLFYEDINKNLRGGIEKVSKVLGKNYSSAEYDTLEDHLNIENFRNNRSVNYDILKNLGILISGEESYVRKGKTGGWKDYFDEELNSRADKWIEENLKDTDLRFPNVTL